MEKPVVGIVMGSDSDLPVMSKAAAILEEFGVPYEMRVISAHREPDVFFEYAKGAEARGLKVIIAGAGMAAHLPGMCAALFPLPVIGVPLYSKTLGGEDSLYSILQMPRRNQECGASRRPDAGNQQSGASGKAEGVCRKAV